MNTGSWPERLWVPSIKIWDFYIRGATYIVVRETVFDCRFSHVLTQKHSQVLSFLVKVLDVQDAGRHSVSQVDFEVLELALVNIQFCKGPLNELGMQSFFC